jgi:hypothetical protein
MNMKRILVAVVMVLAMIPAISFAQESAKPWPELKAFHSVMSATFHPVEEGNYAPLKERAGELFTAVKTWKASAIPAGFKKKETAAALVELEIACGKLEKAVTAKATDVELKEMITNAHNIFHKIVGECRNTEEHH